MAAGAIGATGAAKVSDAEVMAAVGIRDILIANQVVGPIKTRRLMGLIASSGADVIVSVDSEANVRELDAVAGEFGVQPRGGDRGRFRHEALRDRPRRANGGAGAAHHVAPNLRFAGVMAWRGTPCPNWTTTSARIR